MAEPTLIIFGEGTTQDADFLHISKTGMAARIQAIAAAKGKTAAFTPLPENTIESIIVAMFICFEADLTQEKRSLDSTNVQVVFTASGKSLDSLDSESEFLIFSYRTDLYQPVHFPGLNPDSY